MTQEPLITKKMVWDYLISLFALSLVGLIELLLKIGGVHTAVQWLLWCTFCVIGAALTFSMQALWRLHKRRPRPPSDTVTGT
jgi:lysylphosphatidylglycerol synthetase-like protein (DUF2156 family)